MSSRTIEDAVKTRLFSVFNSERSDLPISDGDMELLIYIAYSAQEQGLRAESVSCNNLRSIISSCSISEDHRATLTNLVSDDTFNVIKGLMCGFTSEELRDVVLYLDAARSVDFRRVHLSNMTLPYSLRKLAAELLHIESDDVVADLHCGDGAFLRDALEGNLPAMAYGLEMNASLACLSAVRMSLIGANHHIERGSDFAAEHLHSFDKIFDIPPFEARIPWLAEDATSYLKPLLDGTDPMGRPSSADWIYCRQAFDSLREGGTAVVVVKNGATFNGGDISARRYFVENGMVKAAIALPGRLLTTTGIPLTLLVLGRNDGPVRLVDATDLSMPGRRMDTLSDDAISEIEMRMSGNSDMSRLVSRKELASRDYSLYAPRYLAKTPELVNPARLGDLALSIERGASIRAADLDSLTTSEDTGLYFLRLSDISDGSISEGLPHLKSVDPSSERQWLRSGDLILSKNGAPFKVAVVDVPEGRTVLASGNLYIIRLDTNRVDPYFIAAFLASEDGKQSLECAVVGTTIPNLPLRNLRSLQVPVPDMETQHQVADRYRANVDQIAVLKVRLDAVRAALPSAYEEGMQS